MAIFKAECVGGPCDGMEMQLGRAPQDGESFKPKIPIGAMMRSKTTFQFLEETQAMRRVVYVFNWAKHRLIFRNYEKASK